jgi:acyl carrier protein
VFGYSEIGVMDNFYNLGGDSILALKIISQINATTGITMTIADILNCQTIFESAEFLDKKCRAEGAPDVFESEGQAIGEEAAAALEKEAQEHQESSPRKVESTIQKDVEFDF